MSTPEPIKKALAFDNDFSLGINFPRPNSYPFVCDVNTLAWGICSDTCNQHEATSFREFLFVSGNHGVTVHAFCEPYKTSEVNTRIPEAEMQEGTWVEWGPSTVLSHNAEERETKRWLRTFFTKVETSKSNGRTWTRFPESSSVPPSAMVVSFTIFGSDFPILDFLSDSSTVSPDLNSSSTELRPRSSYKCARLFSSDSHHLIGFVLMSVDPVPVNSNEVREGKWRRIVVVARIASSGIQWMCSVKLDDNVNGVPVDEWTDFRFSDNLLICLNAAGILFFYVAITGEYVAHLDLLQIYGPCPQLNSTEQEIRNEQNGKHMLSYQTHDFAGKRTFKRLLVASHASLLAVIDEYGVAYAVCSASHIPRKYYSFEKLFSQFQHLGLETLVGWEIGGAEIGHQRLFSNASHIMERNFQGSEPFGLMRKIFLPTNQFTEQDSICFSAFGITRLIRKQNSKKKMACRIVHSSLHLNSGTSDESCFNLLDREVFVGDAVGCTFQGCYYLVTDSGLSVVLPSVSISPDFFPIEAIGYRQTSISTSTVHQAGDLFEVGALKQPWLPWKTEVLDRVLLYEGPEEAEHLCFENGMKFIILKYRGTASIVMFWLISGNYFIT